MSESIKSFSATYDIARRRFRSAADAAGLPIQTYVHPLQDPLLPEAAVDVVRIGPKLASKVLFVTSGVHGTELTTGCQRQSKIGPKGSAKCCHFEGGVMSVRSRASIRATALVI